MWDWAMFRRQRRRNTFLRAARLVIAWLFFVAIATAIAHLAMTRTERLPGHGAHSPQGLMEMDAARRARR